MNDMKDKAKGFIDTAADRAKVGLDRAAEYAAQARERVGHWSADPAGAAKQAGERVQAFAADVGKVTPPQVRDFGADLAGFVRRNPIPAALIGIGIGLLLGRGSKS